MKVFLAKWEMCAALDQDPQATLVELLQMRMLGVLDATNLEVSRAALVTALALSPLGSVVFHLTETLREVRFADPLTATITLDVGVAALLAEDVATVRKPPK